jgi:uroporphyrinogen decarboxylase
VELGDVQNQIGDRVAIQGNLDPAVLYASPEVIEKEDFLVWLRVATL